MQINNNTKARISTGKDITPFTFLLAVCSRRHFEIKSGFLEVSATVVSASSDNTEL